MRAGAQRGSKKWPRADVPLGVHDGGCYRLMCKRQVEDVVKEDALQEVNGVVALGGVMTIGSGSRK